MARLKKIVKNKKLHTLISHLEVYGKENYIKNKDYNPIVKGIENNSKKVKKDFIFIAVEGHNQDGHNFIPSAVDNGAACVVVEERKFEGISEKLKDKEVCIIAFKNTRIALAILAKHFYDNPSAKLRLIGITGTNGKTTISYMLKHIIEADNKKTGLIGTISNYIDKKKLPSDVTTPDSLYINKTLYEMLKEGVEYCIMEVSSHALVQDRAAELDFDVIILTNITEDHFDYHNNMDEYFNAKLLIFDLLAKSSKEDTLAIIHDDIYKKSDIISYAESLDLYYLSYGVSSDASYRAFDIDCTFSGGQFSVSNKEQNREASLSNGLIAKDINIPLSGKFNILNALASFICADFFGISLRPIRQGFKSVYVPGRFEVIKGRNDSYIIIDYAHTDDALKNVLKSMRELEYNRIICVFGCGGNRDKTKRPLMGEVSAKLSDFSIITSDNPRKEEPNDIIEDIVVGFDKVKGAQYIKIASRYEAIKKAIEIASRNDAVLIAGKGHEDYQILADRTIHFSDREVVIELLSSS